MRVFILTVAFLCCLGLKLNAQEVQKNYINYQGVANDASGNAIANTAVNIQLALKLGSTMAVASYIENHTVTTTDKGMFSLQIGAGTLVAGNYTTIVWGNDAIFLTVSINGAEIGTTELVAVPYALSSGDNQWSVSGNAIENKNTGKVSITNNLEIGSTLKLENGVSINEFSTDGTLSNNSDVIVPTEKAIKTYVDTKGSSGLEALNEGNGNGWRLKDRSPISYGDIGAQAVDFSLSLSPSTTYGATGSNAAAFGFFTTASGMSSFASGLETIASGNTATAIGSGTLALGDRSVAFGNNSNASGENAIAIGTFSEASGKNAGVLGTNLVAKSFSEVVIGANNTDYTPSSTTEWNTNDRLFVVGNGASNISKNNALIIYKNGKASFDTALEIGTTLKLENGSTINEFSTDATLNDNSDTAIPTEKAVKAYIDASSSTGLESLNEGNGIGWKLKGRNSNNFGNIGLDAVDFSSSTLTTENNGAIGDYSTAFGSSTVASGVRSIAAGSVTKATGTNSVAMGFSSEASGLTSIAMGSSVIASGQYATAFGRGTLSRSFGEVAVGAYNTDYTPSSVFNWSSNDRVFTVGNGTSTSNRDNALTIYKNGNAEFSGEIRRPSTGSADMIPIAYGTVSAGGSVFSGTGNFTVSLSNNIYTVSVTGENLASNNTVCSVIPFTSSFATVPNISYSSNTLRVRFSKVSDSTLTPTSFQFVIYKL